MSLGISPLMRKSKQAHFFRNSERGIGRLGFVHVGLAGDFFDLFPIFRLAERRFFLTFGLGRTVIGHIPFQPFPTAIDALKEVEKTHIAYPNTIGILMFLSAKSDEIVEIMKNATRTQKTSVYDIMRKLDPANSGKYNAIRG